MGFSGFLLVLAGAAAALALWVLVRFPEFSPRRLRSAVAHFGLSLVVVWAGANLVAPYSAGTVGGVLTIVFALVLPSLVYACLAGAWVLRFVHEAITE
jgi:hypothetical protein